MIWRFNLNFLWLCCIAHFLWNWWWKGALITTLELKGRCLILVWHINSVDYGLINSASIDGGSWASWRRVHFLVSCLLKYGKHYLILSLCLRKKDFNILYNVFIAFHQSNSKWDFFAWLIHLLVFMCFVTHFGNLWFGVHVTIHL